MKEYIAEMYNTYINMRSGLTNLILPENGYPILWYGDTLSQKDKILTMQFAPSIYDFIEKTDTEGSQIFRHRERIRLIPLEISEFNDDVVCRLKTSYDTYFYLNPYPLLFNGNFGKMEKIVRSFNASYFNYEMPNIAIHSFFLPFPILKDTHCNTEKANHYLSLVESYLTPGFLKSHFDFLISIIKPSLIIIIGEFLSVIKEIFEFHRNIEEWQYPIKITQGNYNFNEEIIDVIAFNWNYHLPSIPCDILMYISHLMGYEGICLDEEKGEMDENEVFVKTAEYEDILRFFDDLKIRIDGKSSSEMIGSTFIFQMYGKKWALQRDTSVESARYLIRIYEKYGLKGVTEHLREGTTKFGNKCLNLYDDSNKRMRRFYCYIEK